MIKILLLIILITLIITLLTFYLYKNVKNNEAFTTYNNFDYADKLSKDDIKHLKDGQIKMGNMMKQFDNICQKYKIRYFLIAGSLIGVLLYGGWIPWDGDMDLEVHEDDYDTLKRALKTELPKNMWFQDRDTDPNYKDRIIGKLRDLNSCYLDSPYIGKASHQGLQIDINIYKEDDNGRIFFPDDTNVNYLTREDVYPIKRVSFKNDNDLFYVNVMNNPEKYLEKKYSKNWNICLPKNERYPHEGKIDAYKTCEFHYDKYPKLYKK